jgi:hypothetical protein
LTEIPKTKEREKTKKEKEKEKKKKRKGGTIEQEKMHRSFKVNYHEVKA